MSDENLTGSGAGPDDQVVGDPHGDGEQTLTGSGAPSEDNLGGLPPETEEQPEPQAVGHQVIQDNVTEPGTQITQTVDGVTEHTEAQAADESTAEADADDAEAGGATLD